MVGTSFGLARYGYGLLLSEIRASFHLSSAALGLIATGSYVAYLAATALTATAGKHFGSVLPVVAGGLLAVTGMLLVAVAPSPAVLALGVLIAGASAALTYPPFSDAVARDVPERRQGRVLSIISSGTGWGVALAVPIALAAGSHWRVAWVAFAVIGTVSTAAAAIVLRRGARAARADPAVPPCRGPGSSARARGLCWWGRCSSASGRRCTGRSPPTSSPRAGCPDRRARWCSRPWASPASPAPSPATC